MNIVRDRGARLSRAYHRSMSNGEAAIEAAAALREVMARHAAGEIDDAVRLASEAAARWPEHGPAHAYLGQTLVTRQRRFADGLAALARAVELDSGDAYTLYTAGWCHEFVAEELRRPKRAHQPVAGDEVHHYAVARALFLRALEAEPDDQLRGDIEDMLDAISRATGEPWDEGEVERAAPRAR